MVQLKEKEELRHRKKERIGELGRRRKVGNNHQRREETWAECGGGRKKLEEGRG